VHAYRGVDNILYRRRDKDANFGIEKAVRARLADIGTRRTGAETARKGSLSCPCIDTERRSEPVDMTLEGTSVQSRTLIEVLVRPFWGERAARGLGKHGQRRVHGEAGGELRDAAEVTGRSEGKSRL
jgi:hypothetical protein